MYRWYIAVPKSLNISSVGKGSAPSDQISDSRKMKNLDGKLNPIY